MSQPPEWVSDYVGLPFADRGRTVDADGGVDCWGLCRMVWEEQFRITVPSYDGGYHHAHDRESIPEAITDGIADEWQSVEDPAAGDGVVFNVRGIPMHIGVIVQPPKMLHICSGINATYESYESSRWNRRIEGLYRHESRVMSPC